MMIDINIHTCDTLPKEDKNCWFDSYKITEELVAFSNHLDDLGERDLADILDKGYYDPDVLTVIVAANIERLDELFRKWKEFK